MNQFEGHGARPFTGGEAIDGRGHFSGAMLELALELADEERSLLLIALLEDVADADEDGPGDGGDGGGHGERKEEEQLLAQVHGASSIEAEARAGVPSARSWRSRTRAPMA